MKEIIILIISLAVACIVGMIYRHITDKKESKDNE